ncbi:FMN phosphatase YigB, HAD superfamily [Clostridium collagenovorans DSM 3089]|uniref:FMN phosphatase YigB, HAD superfamily n=1 Tax=Clostridium collagenovorans DSM 3089 TaxID=1121306 RepID=A0A1M5S5K0_9CLOT|nr:GNAT family N-acetyltransferase [Clostridium collagenovorans]SHH33877.1 FMN phosphatase YigB, HAD superfamily [Clostridium collagenovorans DSM 3089]
MNHMGTREIATDRLLLREFKESDCKNMYKNWASDDRVSKYVLWDTHKSEDVTKERINNWVSKYENPSVYNWAIELKEINEVIGNLIGQPIHEKEIVQLKHDIKVRCVVFDLFETLLHDIKVDFNSGLAYLHKNILSSDTDEVEFLEYAGTYWKGLYDKRSKDNSELAFEEELLDFKNKYGFKVEHSIEEILFNCALKINTTELFNDTISTLEQLKALEIPVYLLSNSIFKRNIMERFINQYDLEKYFVNIHFSADYKIRKPHEGLFKIVFDDIQRYDATIERQEVYFVGDNFKADALGAKNFGFTPVFLNRKDDCSINKESFIEIKNLNGLLEIIS